MAVAEKKVPETRAAKPLSIPVTSLIGVAYLVLMMAFVFSGLPWLWREIWKGTALADNAFASGALLGLLCIAGFGALGYFGWKLMGGAQSRAGLRAGIFIALIGILSVGLLARWIGRGIESSVYDGWLKDLGPEIGMALAAGIAGLLFFLFGRMFFRARFTKRLDRFESQGWFTAKSYKPGQGLRVRRGTMLAILLLGASGAWVAISNNMFGRGDWQLNVPFTSKARISDPGDAIYLTPEQGVNDALKAQLLDLEAKKIATVTIARPEARDIDRELNRANHHVAGFAKEQKLSETTFLLSLPGDEPFPKDLDVNKNEVIDREKFKKILDEIKRRRREADQEGYNAEAQQEDERALKALLRETTPMKYQTAYSASFTLLPSIEYVLPLLLLGLSFWLAWRIVNLPRFGEFLIATEAEVNKISWTTRHRLYQDTIVVLVTVILMSVFLTFADVVWRRVLSWKHVGVLKIPKGDTDPEGKKLKW